MRKNVIYGVLSLSLFLSPSLPISVKSDVYSLYSHSAHVCVLSPRSVWVCTTARWVAAASALSAIIVPASHFDVDALTLHVPLPLAAATPSRNRRSQSRAPVHSPPAPSPPLPPFLSHSVSLVRGSAMTRLCVCRYWKSTRQSQVQCRYMTVYCVDTRVLLLISL